MAPGDIEVFLPAFREDDFPDVWSLMDNAFQAKYPRFRDWREHISQQRSNCKFAHEVLITSEGLTHHLSPWQARAIITLYLAMLFYWVGDCFRPSHDLETAPPVAALKAAIPRPPPFDL